MKEVIAFSCFQNSPTDGLMQIGQHENAMNGIETECVQLILFLRGI